MSLWPSGAWMMESTGRQLPQITQCAMMRKISITTDRQVNDLCQLYPCRQQGRVAWIDFALCSFTCCHFKPFGEELSLHRARVRWQEDWKSPERLKSDGGKLLRVRLTQKCCTGVRLDRACRRARCMYRRVCVHSSTRLTARLIDRVCA